MSTERAKYPFTGYATVLDAARNTASVLSHTGPTPGTTVRLATDYRSAFADAAAAASADQGALTKLDTTGIEREIARAAGLTAADVTAALDSAVAGAGADVPLLRAQVAAGVAGIARQSPDAPRGWSGPEEAVSTIDSVLGGAGVTASAPAHVTTVQRTVGGVVMASAAPKRVAGQQHVEDMLAGRITGEECTRRIAAMVLASTGAPAAKTSAEPDIEAEWAEVAGCFGVGGTAA